MCRFTERTVRSGFVMAWRLATSPTRISPFFANPTTEGVVRAPSAFGMTTGSPASRTATTEFVVPRSMPTARAMRFPPSCDWPFLSLIRIKPEYIIINPVGLQASPTARARGRLAPMVVRAASSLLVLAIAGGLFARRARLSRG